jgi:hypothetical protein
LRINMFAQCSAEGLQVRFNPPHVRRIEFPNLENAQPGLELGRWRLRAPVLNNGSIQLPAHAMVALSSTNSARFWLIQS